MKVTYKVVDYRPEVEWIAIEFTHSDRPDEPWTEQFAFPDFTREKLIDHIRAVASRVAGSWTRKSDHPAELSIPETGVVDVEPELYLPMSQTPSTNQSLRLMSGLRIYYPARSQVQLRRLFLGLFMTDPGGGAVAPRWSGRGRTK